MADRQCHYRGATRAEWRARPDGLEESVQFTPGYNCADRSMQGHGVHGMEIAWYLRGPAGAAQFKLFTDWIPGTRSRGHGLSRLGRNDTWMLYPMGVDVGYHARRAQYEDQEPIHDDCPIIGGSCWYDGSGMRAETLVTQFTVLGEHVIWAELEAVYQRLVDEESAAAEDERSR